MKITIELPDDELAEALRLTGAATAGEAVLAAVKGFNRRCRVAEMVERFGTMDRIITREELARLREDV